jgi:methylated-DNA-[protein]-cysteine S-methyltransferase
MVENIKVDSPLGTLRLTSRGDSLVEVSFIDKAETKYSNNVNSEVLEQAVTQLNEYFNGKRTAFELPLSPDGTAFQKEIWQALQEIPYGQTITYGELSEKLGKPKAIRAVGTANGSNPIPIIIPCHRVVGSGQKLTGYSGGIERKRWLLQHEGVLLL